MVHGVANEWWLLCTVDNTCPADWKSKIA